MSSANTYNRFFLTTTITLLVAHSTHAYAERGQSTSNETNSCVAYDFNQDGQINGHDLAPMFDQFYTDSLVAQIIERSFASGCAEQLFSYPHVEDYSGEALGEMLLNHYQSCIDIDMNEDGVLDLADAQAIFSSPEFSVRERLVALRMIAREQMTYEIDDIGFVIRPRCFSVDLDGPIFQMPGLYEDLTTRLNRCFEADLNNDNVLNLTDLSIVMNRDSNLTITQRIAYAEAIQSPLCSGILERED